MPERFPYHRGLTIPTCITVRARRTPWCMSGSLTTGFLWSRLAGKTFPAFPAHAQPAIFVSDKSPMDNYHFHGHSHKKSGQNAKSLINYDFIDSILTLSFSVSFYCLETMVTKHMLPTYWNMYYVMVPYFQDSEYQYKCCEWNQLELDIFNFMYNLHNSCAWYATVTENI